MDKSEALRKFYQKNHIDIRAASNGADGSYDRRIAGLSEQVDVWLSKIDPGDHEAFLELLSRYHYLTEACCRQRYRRVLELLEERLRGICGLDEVLFVTIESSGGYKTGSDNVRADLYSRGYPQISKAQILAAQSKLKRKELKRYRAIVFLDDIAGSGITLWTAMERFCERFHSTVSAPNGPLLFYSCIVPRRHGMRHIRRNCKSRGIGAVELVDQDWYEEAAFDRGSAGYLRLRRYEEMVDGYLSNPRKSFFMGFNQNRLLVSFYYSTPNNTLCTFWRKTPGNAPPFPRDGDQPAAQPSGAAARPTIGSLRGCLDKVKRGAYALGMDRREKRKNG